MKNINQILNVIQSNAKGSVTKAVKFVEILRLKPQNDVKIAFTLAEVFLPTSIDCPLPLGEGINAAFTLAEVLITLGIIGVVAALTLPSVINNNKEKTIVTALKKNYSVLDNAFRMAVDANGEPDGWDYTSGTGTNSEKMASYMIPYLKVLKNCGAGQGCFPDENYSKLTGQKTWTNFESPTYEYNRLVLADGTLMHFEYYSPDCTMNQGTSKEMKNVCGSIFVDINGKKLPNKLGVDSFYFYITKYGVFPRGMKENNVGSWTTFPSGCSTKANEGRGCAAWVLYNENLDYLHCDDLSWNGKTKCN